MKCFCLLLLLISSVEIAQDGRLDGFFGTDGKVTTDFDGGSDQANALILQSDGKLVAVGSAAFGNTDFALARYNPDGTLDTSFGTDGKVTTDFNGSFDEVRALVIQPDGKLVAAGKSDASGNDDFALARYLIPSIEVSPLARNLRAKYQLLQPNAKNATGYNIS